MKSFASALASAIVGCALLGCGSATPAPPSVRATNTTSLATSAANSPPEIANNNVDWSANTQSPGRDVHADAADAALYSLCGKGDATLAAVAARGARDHLDGSQTGSDQLPFMLRAAGEPHVWARAWQIAGGPLEEDDVKNRIQTWLSAWNTMGVRRCGIGRATGAAGSAAVYAIAVDALADLDALPTSARVGQWISLEGRLLVSANDAHVVLLGPHGAPKTVVATLDGSKIKSRFAVDQSGPWLVQVLATVATGPRPILEAMIFAGVSPPSKYTPTSAPGEMASTGVADDDEAMFRMINAARASEQLPPFARDHALDVLARTHSEEMLKARMVGHDVGGGDPAARVKSTGYRAHIIGENVASANTLQAAHRALWASPSHRGNILLDRFTKVGVAVIRSPDGQVWVTELFSG